MFIMANVLYTRYHTRLLRYYRGLASVYPLICLSFFLLSLANVALPITLNFIGELFSFIGLLQKSFISTLLSSLGIILSVTYTLLLFNRVFFGYISPYVSLSSDLSRLEFIYITPFLVLPFLLGLFPSIITDSLHSTLSFLLTLSAS